MEIQYLTREQVEDSRWDDCITRSANGLIYAYTTYLDHMAPHWNALVAGDYETVMPLPYNSKFGIHYIYQPFLCAQLGAFGKINDSIVSQLISSIPKKFRLVEISLNHANVFDPLTKPLYLRTNYVLNLNKNYAELAGNYSENIKRNIKKAEQAGCRVQKDIDVDKVIALAVQQMKSYSGEEKRNTEQFKKLYALLHDKKMAATYGITLQDQLVASCVFFFSHHRAYYILVGNHPNGRNMGASHALIDAFIKDHAQTNTILDFEGSDIPGLASFYKSYGAAEEKYAALKMNRLPFYLKWLKK
jgi:lipid II:glycine glycyltransferase (peptidoglycan interpeptide bridge formation enzyme)